MRALLLAGVALWPAAAWAQAPTAVPSITFTGPTGAPAKSSDPIKQSEMLANFGKVATAWMTAACEPINQVLSGISATYLGYPCFPQPNLQRITPGHLQIIGPTGAWGDQTNEVTIIANPGGGGANAGGFGNVAPGFGNNGNQGNYWDPNYRNAYGGQDAAALFINMAARTPVVSSAAVSSYGTATIATPLGNRTVYTIVLATPLTSAQVADMGNTGSRPVNMRVDTSGGYFAYTIPKGLLSPSGVSVPPVSADGRTIVVDGPWVCVTCSPQVLPAAGAIPPTTQTVTIDTQYVEDGTYGSLVTTDLDLINGAAIDERVVVNDKASVPVLNLLDVNQSTLTTGAPFSLKGYMAGVTPGALGGSGLGNAYVLALGGWQVALAAQNGQTPYSGSTYGLLGTLNGPTWTVYGVQNGGFLLGADPGNSCDSIPSHRSNPAATCARTVLLSMAGDFTIARGVHSATVEATGSVTSDGLLLAQAGAQITGSTSFRNVTGQTGYVDPTNGDILMSGVVGAGREYLSPTGGELALHGCNASYVGIMVFIADAVKAGEAKGAGTGAVAVCEPISASNPTPTWARISDNVAVSN